MSTKVQNAKPEFYRRILPEGCIAFSSTEGKTIFKEALLSGHMECYHKLAAQFSTQAEPAFCGLTTLVIVLNALEIDPGKVWKGPWRWYHEDMLECCIPLYVMKENGITFDQFVCLATCNTLDTDSTRVDDTASEETFRNLVTDLSSRDDEFLILSYSRKTLGQTGDGHFSPLGGYHPDRDLVLVMDTARFKYPPHWVPLSTIWEAMKPHDKSTGKSRGYCILSKFNRETQFRFFRLSTSFNVFLPFACTSGVSAFLHKWQTVLAQNIIQQQLGDGEEEESSTKTDPNLVNQILPLLLKIADCISQAECVISTFLSVVNFSKEHEKAKESVIRQIECLHLYSLVRDFLQKVKCCTDVCRDVGKSENVGHIYDNICGDGKTGNTGEGTPGKCGAKTSDQALCAKCKKTDDLSPAHFITVLLLCWPYEPVDAGERKTLGNSMDGYVAGLMEGLIGKDLKEEVVSLKRQLSVLLKMRLENQSGCN